MEFIISKNLWPEIFGWVTTKLQHFAEEKLDQREIVGLTSAITIIAKLIKQSPDIYKDLNDIYT